MAAVESALVPVDTEDTIDSIFAKVRSAGAASVQLLVPDDTAALQTPRGFERLRRRLEAEGITLLVISSDTQTLEAARRNQLLTMAVQGARVQTPHSDADGAARRYATRILPETPIDDRDAAFLDALDHVSPQDRSTDVPDADADLYAALDDLPETTQGQDTGRRAKSADDDFAASLDEWSDLNTNETIAARDYPRTPAPRRRYSADDVDLSADDLARQRGSRRTAAQRSRADIRATPARGTTADRRRASTTGRAYDDELGAYPTPRRNWLRTLLPLAILGLVVLALAAWLLTSRTTVAIAPPEIAASAHPFKSEIIPLDPNGGGSTTAIQAVPVAADAEATTTGTVQTETISPAATAHGEVTIVNTIENAVPLPKGAEFIGKNANGEEVRFTLDADVTVPPAVTTTSLAGRSTTYGQINVTVTARSPGSASNVGENAIKQILIPGQQPIVSDSSNFLIRHAAIGGGSDQPQRIVTEADVQAVLQQALTTLYSNGVQQLRSRIDESKFAIDASTITPSAAELGDPQNYEPLVVEPPIGQPVADPNNPVFTVAVRAHFKALSTPNGQAVTKQLQTVAPQYFAQRSDRPCKPGETQATRVEAIRWDGEKLMIDGMINCQSASGLPPETIAKVRDAVRGQSREAAEASLRTLQQQGLIGAYQLPDKSSFPRFDFLLNVVQGQPQVAEPQPTSGAQ
jgi:hypothetical protein